MTLNRILREFVPLRTYDDKDKARLLNKVIPFLQLTARVDCAWYKADGDLIMTWHMMKIISQAAIVRYLCYDHDWDAVSISRIVEEAKTSGREL